MYVFDTYILDLHRILGPHGPNRLFGVNPPQSPGLAPKYARARQLRGRPSSR